LDVRRNNRALAMKLSAIHEFALRLPEVAEQPHFQYTSFRVRGKIFATAPPEGTHLHVFISEDEREQALLMHAAFFKQRHWGSKVVGLRVDLSKAKLKVVKELIRQAWTDKAPNSLVIKFDEAES